MIWTGGSDRGTGNQGFGLGKSRRVRLAADCLASDVLQSGAVPPREVAGAAPGLLDQVEQLVLLTFGQVALDSVAALLDQPDGDDPDHLPGNSSQGDRCSAAGDPERHARGLPGAGGIQPSLARRPRLLTVGAPVGGAIGVALAAGGDRGAAVGAGSAGPLVDGAIFAAACDGALHQ